jgi:hypothetical protein
MTSLARLVEQFDPGEPFEAPAYWLQSADRHAHGLIDRQQSSCNWPATLPLQ